MTLFGKKDSAIRISVFGKSDVGRTRDHNEDCFIVADLSAQHASLLPEVRDHELGPKGTLIVVADGMGGAAAGEVASDLATKTIYAHMTKEWSAEPENTPQRFAYRLKEAVELANQRIHAYAREHPELKGMGTTTTAVGILAGHLYLTQVGDSRAYLVRQGAAVQLTKDQSLMQRLVDAGELTEEEAEKSERRNIILQALGPDARVRVDLTHQEIRKGDAVVLCSDGLSGQVRKDEIARVVTEAADLPAACGRLIAMANERGGPDNITVVVARLGGDGLADPSGDETVGHEVFPLLDTESTTEPVPVYKGSDPPKPKGKLFGLALATVMTAAALAPLATVSMA